MPGPLQNHPCNAQATGGRREPVGPSSSQANLNIIAVKAAENVHGAFSHRNRWGAPGVADTAALVFEIRSADHYRGRPLKGDTSLNFST